MRTLDLVLRDVPLFEGLTNARRALIAGRYTLVLRSGRQTARLRVSIT